jgi:ribosome maturation factor RimP
VGNPLTLLRSWCRSVTNAAAANECCGKRGVCTEREELISRLTSLVTPIIGEFGVELVELQVIGRMQRPILRVFVDKIGGVTMDDCAVVSRRLALELDTVDIIETSYTLEVSSPGLDRPLLTPADFHRREGKEVRLRIKGCKKTIDGTIVSADGRLILDTPAGRQEFAFAEVEQGLLKF